MPELRFPSFMFHLLCQSGDGGYHTRKTILNPRSFVYDSLTAASTKRPSSRCNFGFFDQPWYSFWLLQLLISIEKLLGLHFSCFLAWVVQLLVRFERHQIEKSWVLSQQGRPWWNTANEEVPNSTNVIWAAIRTNFNSIRQLILSKTWLTRFVDGILITSVLISNPHICPITFMYSK